jgi:hypothetical protein
MSGSRPPIPEPIKRTVRQRCGFGCIFCGAPIYDYDHIDPYGAVREHEPENLTLLCPNHHREKTAGRLPTEMVRQRNATPCNKAQPYSAYHMLYFAGNTFQLRLGGTWFESLFDEENKDFTAVLIDERPLFKFRNDDGHLLADLEAHDSDSNIILKVEAGELRHSPGNWDVQFAGRELMIRRPREIILELVLYWPHEVLTDEDTRRSGVGSAAEPAFPSVITSAGWYYTHPRE